jgi:tetratricopeptide (TPR) repeat protein
MNADSLRVALPLLRKNYQAAKNLNARQKYAESNKLLDVIFKQPEAASDKKFWGEVISLAGDNNFHLGNYALTLQQFQEAEKIFKELKLIGELAEAEINLGAIYKRLGLYAHALFKTLESLTYSFQVNDEYAVTVSLMNAAMSLFETGHADKAFRALDMAMVLCDKNEGHEQYVRMRLVLMNNKATLYIGLKRFEETMELLEQARKIAKKYTQQDQLLYIESNIALCLLKLNRVDEAYKLLRTVIKRRKNVYDDHYVADLIKMGQICKMHFKDEGRFLDYTGRALKLAAGKNLIARQIFIYRVLRDYYSEKSDNAQAKLVEVKLKALEERDGLNKQTGGIERLFDTNMLAVENMLREKEEKPEFLNRYDYMIGTYSYSVHGLTRHIPLRDIGFCEVRGNYMFIHTFVKNAAGKLVLHEGHKLRKTMKDFILEIDTSAAFFARIHNSFLINLYRLPNEEPKAGNSVFIGGRELKISDTYRSGFKKKLNAFFEQELSLQQ